MDALDRIDARILRELARDGRIANLDLAARVGLSPSACLRRVQALERRGIVAGYRARLDKGRLGIGFIAYVTVGLSVHTKAARSGFERAMAAVPEVVECHSVTGAVEYILRVEVPDLAAYKRFHTDHLGVQPGVVSITSFVVVDSPKDERA